MTFYLGIDGGGTKTNCVVGDDVRLLGSAVAGGCNIVRVGVEQARSNLQLAILHACEDANIRPDQIGHTCIGVAGISAPAVRNALLNAISEVVSGTVEVVGDHEIAFEAAFASDAGVIVVSGTGSIALGRNGLGQTARAGGYGFAISDEGSGHWIGRKAIRDTLLAHDAGIHTCLDNDIPNALGIPRSELIKKANEVPPPDFAALFPVVLRAANKGDAVAQSVLQRAGDELAELARVVVSRLWTNAANVKLAMLGGVFKNSTVVRQSFEHRLRELCPNAEVLAAVSDPVMGALALARKNQTCASDRT